MRAATTLESVRNVAKYKSESEQQLGEILETWARWQRALSEKTRIQAECKEAETAAYARFQDTIESGLDATAEKSEIVSAHYATVTEWGNYQEVLAGCKEARKAAKEVVQESAALMNEAIQASKQTLLPFDEPGDG